MRHEARHVWRRVRRRWGLFATAALLLGISLGLTGAFYAMVDALHRQLVPGVSQAEQLRRLQLVLLGGSGGTERLAAFSYPAVADLGRVPGVRGVAGATLTGAEVGIGSDRQSALISLVTPNYFAVLGVGAAVGSMPSGTEGTGESRVVLSHDFWVRVLGRRNDVIGRPIRIGAQSALVVAVAAPDFLGTHNIRADAWVTIADGVSPSVPANWRTDEGNQWLELVVRLPVSDVTAAEDAAVHILERGVTAQALEGGHQIIQAQLRPLAWSTNVTPQPEARAVTILLAGAMTLLLLGVLSVATLFLIDGQQRQSELAARFALGATRGQVIRELVAEAVALAGLGALPGLLIALKLPVFLFATVFPGLPVDPQPDLARVLVVMLACVTLVIGGTCIWPALRSTRTLSNALRADQRAGGRGVPRTVFALLSAQVAVSLVLLALSAVSIASVMKLERLARGVDSERTLAVTLVDEAQSFRAADFDARLSTAMERLRALPSVAGVSMAVNNPFFGGSSAAPTTPGVDAGRFWRGRGSAYKSAVGPGFFRAIGARGLQGRDFEAADRSGGQRVVVLNKPLAQMLFPHVNPLGRCVVLDDGKCAEVVGIADGVWKFSILDRETKALYVPVAQEPDARPNTLLVNGTSTSVALMRDVRTIVRQELGNAVSVAIQPLDIAIRPMMRPWRAAAQLFSGLAVIATIIAAIGVYSANMLGVLAQYRDLSIRLVLGASARRIWFRVARASLLASLLGSVVGVGTCFALLKLAESAFPAVISFRPGALWAPAAILVLAALAATALPIRKLMRAGLAGALR